MRNMIYASLLIVLCLGCATVDSGMITAKYDIGGFRNIEVTRYNLVLRVNEKTLYRPTVEQYGNLNLGDVVTIEKLGHLKYKIDKK